MFLALGDFCRGKISQPIIPGMQTGLAARDRENLIAPGVEFVRQFPQLDRAGSAGVGQGRGWFRDQGLVRKVRRAPLDFLRGRDCDKTR